MPSAKTQNTVLFWVSVLCMALYISLSFLAVHTPEVNYFSRLTILGAVIYFILLCVSTKNTPLKHEIRFIFLSLTFLHFAYSYKLHIDMNIPFDFLSSLSNSATMVTFVDIFREFATTAYKNNRT